MSVDSQAATAERKFNGATELSYALIIYNATLDPVTRRPRPGNTIVVVLCRQAGLRGAPKALQIKSQEDFKQVLDAGTIDLGTAIAAGDYALKIMVTDVLQPKGSASRIEERWIGFDVCGHKST
jgi:hypothetical protein